jgi:hypothetical protein
MTKNRKNLGLRSFLTKIGINKTLFQDWEKQKLIRNNVDHIKGLDNNHLKRSE